METIPLNETSEKLPFMHHGLELEMLVLSKSVLPATVFSGIQ
jgi:hypothetical protein